MTEELNIMDVMESRAKRREDRRDFFRQMGGKALLGGIAAATAGTAAHAQAAPTEADVLNFALNLEYLEAQFYSFAVNGSGLAANLLTPGTAPTATAPSNQGAVTGGRAVRFTDPVVQQYAREIAADEIAHVRFLRSALGVAAVAQPAIDIGSTPSGAFSSAARAAGLIGPGESFDPYASDENFLLGSFIFEDVGVTAYKGAARLLSTPGTIEAAAGILAVEAYHAAIVRTVLYAKGIQTPSLRTSADAISNARDSLDGSDDRDQGISPIARPATPAAQSPTASNIVPLDGNGLAFSRSAGQVLNIVYLNSAAVGSGGFFPAGVNGNIKTSAASA